MDKSGLMSEHVPVITTKTSRSNIVTINVEYVICERCQEFFTVLIRWDKVRIFLDGIYSHFMHVVIQIV